MARVRLLCWPGARGLLAMLVLAACVQVAPALGAEPAGQSLGGVRATGFDGGAALDYLKGSGSGFFLSASARTEYRLLQFRSAHDEVISRHPLWQSFRFAIRDDHPRRRIAFEAALRGGGDLERPGFRGEVLYAFVDVAPASRWSSVRLGRQLLAVGGAAGLLRFDGVLARFNLRHLGVEAYGGVPLRSRVVVLPDDEQNVTGWGRDWAYGVALRAIGLPFTQARLGFQERFRDGELARRQLSFDFHKGVAGRLNIDGELVVDLLGRRLEEVLVAVDARPVRWLGLGVEYAHWQAAFDANELFSVFTTDPYDSVRGELRLQPLSWISLWAGGGAQIYPPAVTRDNVPRPESGRASAAQRFGIRVQPLSFLAIEFGERIVMGTGGDKQALHLALQLTTPKGRLRVRLRGDLQRYGFDLQPQLAGNYGSASLDLRIRPLPWLRVVVAGRAVFSPWLENQFQVTSSLDLLLGVRRVPGRGGDKASARLEDWQPALLLATIEPELGADPVAAGLVGGIGVRGQDQ